MAYPKDSTIASQLSEYDNVPHLSNYYYNSTENTRRAYDPSYELRYGDLSRTNPSTQQIRSATPNSQVQKDLSSYNPNVHSLNFKKLSRFPNSESLQDIKEENCLNEYYQQKTNSLRKQLRKDRQRIIPKVRPQETIHFEEFNSNYKMARVPSFFFYFLVFLAEILLFGVLILSLVWVQFYQDGFAWREDVRREFNLHPVLMITGFIFLMGHAMLVYRLFGCCNKLGAKLLHTILYLMAVPCIVVATIAVFDSHDLRDPPIPNLYSLHSWMGVVTIGLFALQVTHTLVVGFFSFWMLLLCEQGTSSFRASLVPIHSSFGLITFMLAIATCVTGLTEKAFFSLKNESGESIYKDLPVEAFIINAIGTTLIALGILIPSLVGIRYFRSSKYRDEMSAHL